VSDIPAVITGTNGSLIAAVAALGYLNEGQVILDATYGRGAWWTVWRPRCLVTMEPPADFRSMTWDSDHFDVVCFDPPYRLNGTPDRGDFDRRYGIDVPMRWQDKHQMIRQGIDECLRVLKPRGLLLVKCQDQVCSGRVRWQAREFTEHAEGKMIVTNFVEGDLGPEIEFEEVYRARQVEMMHLLRPVRPQPPGRDQVHARRNYSTLLILEKA
jgi:hypothetical protein